MGYTKLDCWSFVLCVSCIRSPYILFNLSGQFSYWLSFLIVFLPHCLAPQLTKLQRSFSMTALMFGATLPLLWYHLFEWNLLSILCTLLLTPFLTFIFLPSILPLGVATLFFDDLRLNIIPQSFEKLLTYLNVVLEKVADFETTRLIVGKPSLWLVMLYVAIFVYFLRQLEQQKFRKKSYILLFSIVCCIGMHKFLNPFGIIAIVDIGQGDAIFIQSPFHRGNILIDTGGKVQFSLEDWRVKFEKSTNAERTLIPFLKSRGVKTIDHLFVTHGHTDHMGDLANLTQYFKIKKITFPSGTETKKDFKKTLVYLDRQGTEIHSTLAEKNFHYPNVELKMLYPYDKGQGENNDSLVLWAKVKNKTFLLTGDLEKEGERKLLDYYPSLDVDILKVGHHGSKTSSSLPFLKQIRPQQAIISCGKENRFGHPHPFTLQKLYQEKIKVYRTDLQGMIYYDWFVGNSKLSSVKVVNSIK